MTLNEADDSPNSPENAEIPDESDCAKETSSGIYWSISLSIGFTLDTALRTKLADFRKSNKKTFSRKHTTLLDTVKTHKTNVVSTSFILSSNTPYSSIVVKKYISDWYGENDEARINGLSSLRALKTRNSWYATIFE